MNSPQEVRDIPDCCYGSGCAEGCAHDTDRMMGEDLPWDCDCRDCVHCGGASITAFV